MAEDPSSSADSGRSSGDGILEWEIGLPTDDDLTPLSQSLVPPELASAFSISPEPLRTMLDVYRASQNTVSGLRLPPPSHSNPPFPSFSSSAADGPMVFEADEPSRKSRRPPDPSANAAADAFSARPDASSNDDQSACTLKRPRLVWTPQLHKRFVDVVAHLGIKDAVPKTIMQLMNVEGLTRENVASHLQKYRLYLKRMQGLSNEGPSSSDHLFASTPLPLSLHEPPPPMPVLVPYAMPTMMPVPVYGMPHQHEHGMVPVQGGGHAYRGFEAHHPYGEFGERPKDWPSGNNFGPIV